ncbi:MAG: RluA family pseudouridine synthase [Bacteroidales bacterium]|nr:RluA family pseudouridine synthase [Bacteroidales bacterium]
MTPGQRYTVKHDGPLLSYLYEIFPDRSKTGVKNLLSKGQVLVNNEPRTAFDQPLFQGDRIIILPKGLSIARQSRDEAREAVGKEGVRIVFEDEHYLVVDKPSGLLSVSTARGSKGKTGHKEATLYAILNNYVKVCARLQRKEDLLDGRQPDRTTAKVWIVHRLDKGTSGLLIFAKDERAKDILQSRWKDLVIERKYIAYLEKKVEKESGAIQSWLVESPKSFKMYSSPVEVRGGQLAITHYKVLDYVHTAKGVYAKAEFSLESGRKNQIRVHAADIGHPVAGDEKYGAQTDPVRRLALHAATLVFRNPYTEEVVRCQSPLPDVFLRFEKR